MKIIVEDERLQTLVRITFPRIVSGITAGAIFALITSFDELTVSPFVTGPKLVTLPIQLHNCITHVTDPPVAVVSAAIVFIIIGGALLLKERLVGLDRLLGLL